MYPGIHNFSEIGKLNKVLLHRPGEELESLTPATLERLLFDDIPYLKVAQEEHDRFAEVLRENGVEVIYYVDEVAKAIADPARQIQLVNDFLNISKIHAKGLRASMTSLLLDMPPKQMVTKMIAGIKRCEVATKQPTSLMDLVDDDYPFVSDPMPNLYFTRDPFACVGNGVNLNRMYSVTRNRETLYGKYIFKYHPDYKGTPLWFRRDAPFHTEGGDVLNLTRTALAVGISQRTQAAAIDLMAQNIFWKTEGCEIEKIFAFDIPASRAFMHLDTVFTQIDVDKVTIHPAIMGTLRVYEMTKGAVEGEVDIKEHTDSLEKILEYATGVDGIKLIPCGGGDPIAAAREQWNDGSNTLCVEPGTICVYQRNNVTNEVLYKEGLNLLVVPSAELSRGRGGPRCMSMPFQREDL